MTWLIGVNSVESEKFRLVRPGGTGPCSNQGLGAYQVRGQSALEYYLNGFATIPDDLEIFLDTTWRMHPDVDGFISEAIYENRVKAHPKTAKQQVLHSKNSRLVTQATGIVYLPVPHDGNSQCSMEEVDTIERVVEELLATRGQDRQVNDQGYEIWHAFFLRSRDP